jgi:thiosulfate reductase cytochrome b subunit
MTESTTLPLPHPVLVRVTHWINALAFIGLAVSGAAILLAHPRLYWGEAGAVGMPSLVDLPLPFVLTGQSGWGRSLHFLSAWICVLIGLIYACFGFLTGHFRTYFVTYTLVQRLTYAGVIFILFPLMIWTGLAMSPAMTSVMPALVTVFGGQQSARTIHFFVSGSLVLFLLVHIAMVVSTGFISHMRAMTIGTRIGGKDRL